MPSKYTIPESLYERALKEFMVGVRGLTPLTPVSDNMVQSGAKALLDQALAYVEYAHKRHLANTTEDQELAKQISLGENARMLLFQNHRAGLIYLLTMENGITRATAEEIVDKHILIHS